MILLASSIL
jgi:hypothetical protein